MAAAAAVEIMGGTPEMCMNAASGALANLLGLVCDPIAGLVEAPCQRPEFRGSGQCHDLRPAGPGRDHPGNSF